MSIGLSGRSLRVAWVVGMILVGVGGALHPLFGLAAVVAGVSAMLFLGYGFATLIVWLALQLPYVFNATALGAEVVSSSVAGVPAVAVLGVAFALGCLMVVVGAKTRPPVFHVTFLPWWAFLLVSGVSAVVIGAGIGVSAGERLLSLGIPLLVALGVAAGVLEKPVRVATVIDAIAASLIVAACSGLLGGLSDLLSGGELGTGGFLGHPASLGYYCAAMLPVVMAALLMRADRQRWEGYLLFAATLLGLAGLLAAASRGAWLSFLVASVVVGVFYDKRVSLSAIGVAAAIWVLPALSGRVEMLITQFFGGSSDIGSGRAQIWAVTLRQIDASPWVGHGFNSYFGQTKNLFIGSLAGSFTHNDYLFEWFELGVAGPLLLALSGITVVWWAAKRLREERDEANRALLVGCLSAGIVVLIGRMFDNLIFMTSLQVHVFALLGAAVGAVAGSARLSAPVLPAAEALEVSDS